MKKCTKCKKNKQESDFYFKNKIKQKLHSRCKQCCSKEHQQHYIDNISVYKTRAKKNNKEYKQRNRIFINSYKSNVGCCYCDENEAIALDFHHTDKKVENVSKLVNQSVSINRIKKEIENCIVICSNCHRKLHAGLIDD